MAEKRSIGFFEKFLTLWVILCMGAGVLIGQFLPGIPAFLSKFEYARVSIPVAVLIWLMIYPMMLKVDFASIVNVGRNPKGLIVTWIVNWLIKPFTMFGIASLFFFVIFKALIPQELATQYLAGAVLLGAAPCTAMVFVWSYLTRGNPAYTLVQVATNDLIILDSVHTNRGVFARSQQHRRSLDDIVFVGRPLCGYSACRRLVHQGICNPEAREGLLRKQVHP